MTESLVDQMTEEQKRMVCRLLLMMYRQGWLDAAIDLRIRAASQTGELKRQYEDLLT